MSVEWHEYSPDNIYSCQECKDLYDKYKDEDGQVEDYHEEVPIGEETFSQRYSIENKKKSTKRGYDASLSNLIRGDNVRFKKENYGNSQLDNLEVYDDEAEDENEDYKPKRRYDASLSNLIRGDNVRFKKGNYGNSQLDNLEVYDDEDEDKTYGGKRRRRTHKRNTHHKRKTHYKRKTHRRKRTMKKRRN